MAANKVEVNGETIIDLTSDTATESDVLAGKSFHLASGAVAVGSYSPASEIRAYARTSVGHASKNALELLDTGDVSGTMQWATNRSTGAVSFTGAPASDATCIVGILCPGLERKYTLSGCPDGGSSTKYALYAYDITAGARTKKWDGTTTSSGCVNSDDVQEILVPSGHVVQIRVMVKAGVDMTTVSNFRPLVIDADITTKGFEVYRPLLPTLYENYELNSGGANLTNAAYRYPQLIVYVKHRTNYKIYPMVVDMDLPGAYNLPDLNNTLTLELEDGKVKLTLSSTNLAIAKVVGIPKPN